MRLSKLFHKVNKTFLVWLISYISILIIPLIISGLLYMASGKAMVDEINKANEAFMMHMRQIIDDSLVSMRNIGLDIGWDSQVFSIAYESNISSVTHQDLLLNTIQKLRMQSTSNRLIEHLYITFFNSDTVLSPSARYSFQEVYDFYHKSDDFSFEEWNSIIRKVHRWDYTYMPWIITTVEKKDIIAFMQSVPIEHSMSPMGTIVIMVDRNKLAGILKQAQWVSESAVYIIDREDRILVSTNPSWIPENITYSSLTKPGKFIDCKIGNEEAVLTYLDSRISDWKYVSVIPKRIFFSKAKHIRNLTMAGIISCLVLGAAFACFLANKNYNPVRKILETLSEKAGFTFTRESDEFDFINRSIENTVAQKEQISMQLRAQYQMLKSNFLSRLMKGNIGDIINAKDAIANYELDFCSDYFLVMLFMIDDLDGFFPKEEEKIPGESVNLAKSVIANVVKELIEKTDKAYLVEIDETVAFLINFKESAEKPDAKKMEAIADEARKFIEKEFRIKFTVAISSIHENIFGISSAYQEAIEALEYKFIVGEGYIISYDSLKTIGNDSYKPVFSLEVQQKFMNCIKTGQMEAAANIMENVIDCSLTHVLMPIAMAKCLMFAMLNTIINALRELNIVYDKLFLEQLNPVERLLQCTTALEMKQEIKSILGKIGEYITASDTYSGKNLIPSVIQYIKEHYGDKNLSVSVISEYFGMNPSYLSRCMKSRTGESLFDCLNRVRLDKAKELLKNKSMNINEISERVGFFNNNTFIRTFKKYEGITPGKYREMKFS